MKYRFYSNIQGIIDYDFSKSFEFDSYFNYDLSEDFYEMNFAYLTAEDLKAYQKEINEAINNGWNYEIDENKGLMHYFSYGIEEEEKYILKKVTSVYPKIECVNNKAYAVMVCDIKEPLAERDIEILKEYFEGQYSDGWGEGFSQRGIETSDGILYLDFWPDNFQIETEDELKTRLEFEQSSNIDIQM